MKSQDWMLIIGVFASAAACFSFLSCASMEQRAVQYAAEAAEKMEPPAPGTIISESDLEGLPQAAQRYFRYSGVIGKARINSFSVVLEGRIRNDPSSKWMDILMRQYNRLDAPARIVYIESPKPPMAGIDSFIAGRGRMHIKTMNFITVVDSKGPEMDISALVTFLNDLCLCPSAYFALPLVWKEIDRDRVELSMDYRGMTARARLTIDGEGKLTNWESGDRYAEVKGKNLKDRWSTPFYSHAEIQGMRIPSTGAGIHDYNGAPYVYVELDRIHSLRLDASSLPPRP